jgi:hypothetical protein
MQGPSRIRILEASEASRIGDMDPRDLVASGPDVSPSRSSCLEEGTTVTALANDLVIELEDHQTPSYKNLSSKD